LSSVDCRFHLRIATVGLCLCIAVSWTACSTRSEAPPPAPIPIAVPPPIAMPAPEATPARSRTVKASYQGSATAGHQTASGEPYNPNAMTAASRTLPIGSTVKVINPETGRSVKVRINDRGPFVHGRNLDLSKRAAEKLGITHKGVTKLKVTPVSSHAVAEESDSSTSHTVAAEPASSSPHAVAADPGLSSPEAPPVAPN
jgi:rare lipoprotein A